MSEMTEQERQDREIEALAAAELALWRSGGSGAMDTLQLRAACQAADREGDTAAVRELSAVIDVREQRDGAA